MDVLGWFSFWSSRPNTAFNRQKKKALRSFPRQCITWTTGLFQHSRFAAPLTTARGCKTKKKKLSPHTFSSSQKHWRTERAAGFCHVDARTDVPLGARGAQRPAKDWTQRGLSARKRTPELEQVPLDQRGFIVFCVRGHRLLSAWAAGIDIEPSSSSARSQG